MKPFGQLVFKGNSLSNSYLEVVMGSMFCGKTTYLINTINQEKRRSKVGYFRFTLQDMGGAEISPHEFKTHDGTVLNISSFLVSTDWNFNSAEDYELIVLDEIQFLDSHRVNHVRDLVEKMGKKVLVSGLDMDFRGEPFETTTKLSAFADRVTKLHSICEVCGNDAVYSQKTSGTDDRLEEGGAEKYRPVCRKCYRI